MVKRLWSQIRKIIYIVSMITILSYKIKHRFEHRIGVAWWFVYAMNTKNAAFPFPHRVSRPLVFGRLFSVTCLWSLLLGRLSSAVCLSPLLPFLTNKKPRPCDRGSFHIYLAVPYSHMGKPHTTIGISAFHFWVRYGVRWDHRSIAARIIRF